MKKCSSCKLRKPSSAFSTKQSSKDGLQSMCKDCKNEYNKKHYKSKPKYFLEKNKRLRLKLRKYIQSEKQKPCADCGNRFHACAMEFDHLPQYKKLFNISEAVTNNIGLSKLKEELSKCELVCAICHAYRTFRRRTGANIVPWCNGNTSVSGTEILGSNPSGTV